MGCLKLTYQNNSEHLKVVYNNAFALENNAQRFLRVDPLAHLRSWVSPYNYVQNNPIMRIDPDGRLDDEFNVNSKTGEIKKVSDKGGIKLTTTIWLQKLIRENKSF
jgi:RHS repeat-associated protein